MIISYFDITCDIVSCMYAVKTFKKLNSHQYSGSVRAVLPGDVFQYARDKLELPANVPLALYEEVHAGRTDELTPTKHLNDVSVVFCTWLISLLTMKDAQ